MNVIMMHSNAARLDDGEFVVDRKFHIGMEDYARQIGAPLITVHPEASGAAQIMDPIRLPRATLPYCVMVLRTDASGHLLEAERDRLRSEIARSSLVYGGSLGSPSLARKAGVPYILVLEYDLPTQITVTTTQLTSPLRRWVRTLRCVANHLFVNVPDIRGARSLHCNGYPVYDSTRHLNPNSLLYLDSRMSTEMIIDRAALSDRLASRAGRSLRLLYSGRYEPLKGVIDAVQVGLECIRRGVDIELHLYGQGSLRNELEAQVAKAPPGTVTVHDAIPYPELVKVSRSFDLFVCCHVQNDPSCTYLESFGSGLPIVGYANRMWRRLCAESAAGFASPLGNPVRVADDIERLIRDPALLATQSQNARRFAVEHAYEREHARRINEINRLITPS